MLVAKTTSFKFGDVICIKFVTGEEIIAQFNNEDHESVLVTNPLCMVLTTMNENDQAFVAFSPFLLGAADHDIIPLSKQHIITKIKARDDASRQYLQALDPEPQTENAPPAPAPLRATSATAGGRGARGVKM